MQKFVIGSGRIPDWCSKALMTYRKMDGSVGYELFGTYENFQMEKGDVLLYNNGRIEIPNIKEKRRMYQ